MMPFDGKEFGEILLGTLVRSRKKIVFVTSLSYASRRSRKNAGPVFLGEINGLSMMKFEGLQVTAELLQALGWTVDRSRTDRTIATPGTRQFAHGIDPHRLDVHFMLQNDSKEGWDAGKVIARNMAGQLVDVASFHRLDRLFLETFAQRMDIEFEGDFDGYERE